jgi:hypothetical protein
MGRQIERFSLITQSFNFVVRVRIIAWDYLLQTFFSLSTWQQPGRRFVPSTMI